MPRLIVAIAAAVATLMTLAGCASTPDDQAVSPATDQKPPASATAPLLPLPKLRKPTRSLGSFAKSNTSAPCYDRDKERYTAVVDAHFHPRPFGGQSIPPAELFGYIEATGVRFINYFGIGQSLDMASDCTYYLNCPGVSALPSIKNDFVNGEEVKLYPHPNLHIVLSMTFIDLAHPETAVETIELYDREFPGMFKWAGELNVIKQALLKNNHEPATIESIDKWSPFMQVLRERNIPVTLHSDLGNDANPTQFAPLMKHILQKYPDNKIVWAHMGLSKELSHMDPKLHIGIMKQALDAAPNLMLDISWDVIYEAYREFGADFVAFFNEYPDRILPGSDFVAARNKKPDQYAKEQEITSRVNRFLSDEAFRKIALGENYFRLLNLDYQAPEICPKEN